MYILLLCPNIQNILGQLLVFGKKILKLNVYSIKNHERIGLTFVYYFTKK